MHQRTDGKRRGWHPASVTTFIGREAIMGKYFLAWIMGVPAIVLVLIYLFMH
ncbi:hypothetical protein GCM10027320_43220 [Massilia solisilvae]